MKQLIRQASVPEVVARAYHAYLRNLRRGRSSKRVTVWLPSHLLPPDEGVYETGFGSVRIRPFFLREQGRWAVTVIFPAEGFKVSDFVQPQQPPQKPKSSPPSPSWKEHTPSEEEIREVWRILGILEE